MQQGLKSRKRQWVDLLTLSGLHATVDMFVGMLAVLLPVVRETYSLSLTLGVVLLSAQSLACNGVQLLIGHLRADKKTPLLISVGLALATLFCFLGLIPQQASAVVWVFVLTIISGIGVAFFHPEGLRAVHHLKDIPPATSSSVFLTAGFAGTSCGSWFASVLVSHWGLKGLLLLTPLPALLWGVFKKLNIQLAVEPTDPNDTAREPANPFSIWSLYAMMVPAGTASMMTLCLLPTRLHELGFSLIHGGMANMMIGVGAITGSLILARLASNGRELVCVTLSATLAIPFYLTYMFWMEKAAAIGFLVPFGFFAISIFPLMVSLARHARGRNLGFRMSLIVGGTWGVAHLVIISLSPIAEKYGIQSLLNFIWLGYLLSAIIGTVLYRKHLRINK